MEGGVPGTNGAGYEAKFTWTAFLCCLCASSGGALFGYDNGQSIELSDDLYMTLVLDRYTALCLVSERAELHRQGPYKTKLFSQCNFVLG